jgi:hypothetical protein
VGGLTLVDRAPATSHTDDNDDSWLDHWYCCDPRVALCGAAIVEWDDDEVCPEHECVVCRDLLEVPCSPRCDYVP